MFQRAHCVPKVDSAIFAFKYEHTYVLYCTVHFNQTAQWEHINRNLAGQAVRVATK